MEGRHRGPGAETLFAKFFRARSSEKVTRGQATSLDL